MQLFQGDCLDIMPLIPDKSVQLILADLPYGTTQCKWDSVLPLDKLWAEYERIITDKGAMIFTASQPFTTILTASNINHFKYSLVWVKTKATGHLDAKKKPMKKHEDILVFCKNGFPNYYPQGLIDGEFKTGRDVDMEGRVYGQYKNHKISTKGNYPKSVLEIPNPSGKGNPHPTAKPIERSMKSAGSKTASTTPSLRASLAFIIVLLLSALSMMTWTARSGPINLGRIVAPPHPGTNPRKTSGKAVKAVVASVR